MTPPLYPLAPREEACLRRDAEDDGRDARATHGKKSDAADAAPGGPEAAGYLDDPFASASNRRSDRRRIPCTMMNRRILPIFLLAILLGTHSPARAAGTSREFNPMQFFTGHTRSTGTFRDRAGRPTQRVRTETLGRIVQGELRMEQDLEIEGKPRQHRSWKVRRVARDRYEATANDMVGKARGRVTGNTFDWSFILATKPPNPIYNVRMTQHMTLEPGGQVLRNDTTFRKLGIVLTTCSERFQKVR